MEKDCRFQMGGRRLLGHSILVVAILLVVGPGLETCSKWGRQAAGMGEDIPLWTWGLEHWRGHDRLGDDRETDRVPSPVRCDCE